MPASRINWERARARERRREQRAERKLGAMTDKRRQFLSAEQERLKRDMQRRLQEREP